MVLKMLSVLLGMMSYGFAYGESVNPYLGKYQIWSYSNINEYRSHESLLKNRTWMISEEFSGSKKICWENRHSRECEFLGKEVPVNATTVACRDLDRGSGLSFADSIPLVIASCFESNYWKSNSTLSVEYGSGRWMKIVKIDAVTFRFDITSSTPGVGYDHRIDEGFVLKKIE
jgi:hypothetical protein